VAFASTATSSGLNAALIGIIIGQFAGKSVVQRIWNFFMALQIAVLVQEYENIIMPAISKQTISTIQGIITMEALDPEFLLEKIWPSAAEQLKNP
jgi:hypothetical protein